MKSGSTETHSSLKQVGIAVLRAGLFSVLLSTAVWAQAISTSQISGTVRDQSGAVLPGVEITVTQTGTDLKRTAITDETGSYLLTNLPVGPYRLEAALASFGTYAQTGIVLQVNSSPVINAVLRVGRVSETVEVQAGAALVETQSSGVGTVVDNQRILEMPLNGRNPTELVLLSGLANIPSGSSGGLNGKGFAAYPQIVVSVTGGVGNGVLYLLDGANHNDTQVSLNLPLPFPDALQEFKVEANALPAQYGDHAATVNAVTKSGTNRFHGDLFEFVRNGIFNARDFFATRRDTLKRNQFGGTIGGPIKKNKLFFFAGYQGTMQRSDPPISIAYVPTPDMLAGDFTTIASPACNGNRQITLAASQGFVNNKISPSRFDPVALKIESSLPKPSDPCGQVTFGLKQNPDEQLALGRIDYQRNEKHSMFGRILIADHNTPSTYDGKNPLTSNTVEIRHRVYSATVGDTYLLGAGTVSSFRIGVNRGWDQRTADQLASWATLGAQSVTPMAGELAPLSVTGNGFSVSAGTASRLGLTQGPHTNVAEDMSLIKGAHQIGFGVNYFHLVQNYFSYLNAAGTMTVNGQVSGLPLADFLLGNVSGWSQGNVARYYYRQNHTGIYIQDSWKMSPRVKLNYGLRWEPHIAPTSADQQWEHFDPALFARNVHSTVYPKAPAGLTFPGDPQFTIGNHPESDSWSKFFPRLGLVWDPRGDGLMTIRAAYGMFSDRQQLGTAYVTFTQNPPFGNTVSLTNVKLSNPWATYPGGNPFPFVLDKNTNFPLFGRYRNNPLHYKSPYLNQWNLSIQKQFGTDWLVTANYIGSSSIHFVTSTQLNPAVFLGLGACSIAGVNYPICSTTANTNQRRTLFLQNPQEGQYYAAINSVDDGGTANYNALLLSLQKRLSRGVSLLANHTWSHCIGDIWDQGLNNPANVPGGRKDTRGNCNSGDQRHVFNLSAVFQTPHYTSGALQVLGSNWQLSPILKLRSAQLFTATTGLDNALSAQAAQVPNLIPGANPYASNKTVDHWLNPAAFTMPDPGTIGNLGWQNLKGPGIVQLDMSLSRTFTLREGQTLQLRAEAFNLPNHLNPSTPVATLNSGGTFGKIQSDISGNSGLSAGDSRILQFAVKLAF